MSTPDTLKPLPRIRACIQEIPEVSVISLLNVVVTTKARLLRGLALSSLGHTGAAMKHLYCPLQAHNHVPTFGK